jgi:hypothetical protein
MPDGKLPIWFSSWREASNPSSEKEPKKTLRNSGQELAFRKQQAHFSTFLDEIQRAEKIHGKRRGEEPIESIDPLPIGNTD